MHMADIAWRGLKGGFRIGFNLGQVHVLKVEYSIHLLSLSQMKNPEIVNDLPDSRWKSKYNRRRLKPGQRSHRAGVR